VATDARGVSVHRYSINDVFEDKIFLTFDKRDPACDGTGRAYFVKKSTGQICFINRYATEEERRKGKEKESRVFRYMLLVFLLIMGASYSLAPPLFALYSPYVNVINNSFLLIGLVSLLLPLCLFSNKKGKKMIYEDYKKAARSYPPICIDDKEKEEVLKRLQKRKWLVFLLCLILLFSTIGLGYQFVTATEMGISIMAPAVAAVLFLIVLGSRDRWCGWRLASKMYWAEAHGRKDE
jgi:hypothetical protein